MTSNTQSDIEIYIKDCTIDVIKEWLETRLGPVTLIKQEKIYSCSNALTNLKYSSSKSWQKL